MRFKCTCLGSNEPNVGSNEPDLGSNEPDHSSNEPDSGSNEPGQGPCKSFFKGGWVVEMEAGLGSNESYLGPSLDPILVLEHGLGSSEPDLGSFEPDLGS
ncbi:hypothetical protein F8M41_023730 [Gigaspora margarita]|uniref:Uncharacterized protein n=1 Tax=Gigaspora margarita TaxID=4874 RepID=A0A8H4ET98_GIGMA|nr:hypothetical protein F8M41_023730 [Gigaspora margarita]